MNVIHRSFLICLTISWILGGGRDLVAQGAKPQGKVKPKSSGMIAINDLTAGVQEYSSRNFLLHTDLSVTDSKELLERLEKMLELVSAYYGKPNSRMIEINVVNDRNRWPFGSIPADAINSILNESGITLSVTTAQQNELGEKQFTGAKSVVWAVATRGVPQHETVHAYCHQIFGRTGPTWYAEGMAELGKYWRDKDEGVNVDDDVIKYLKASDPKSLADITSPGQRTGDGWRNYAWRWALCHLLSTNPNYSSRFQPLGIALLNGQRTRFEDVYGSMSQEISFEYQFFLKHFDQGFRCESCAWDWKTRSQRLHGSMTTHARISANRGWQASRVQVKNGDKISYTSTGEWAVKSGGAKIGPDGDQEGQGRLIGVLFYDYQLSEPFDLGGTGEYEATRDGHLFVRCRDDWCELADNSGTVVVKFNPTN